MEIENKQNNSEPPNSAKPNHALAPEVEAALIAKWKADVDSKALEAECRELLSKRDKGELLSFEQLLHDLYGIDAEVNKEQI